MNTRIFNTLILIITFPFILSEGKIPGKTHEVGNRHSFSSTFTNSSYLNWIVFGNLNLLPFSINLLSPNDGWIVGSSTKPEFYHWDGFSWQNDGSIPSFGNGVIRGDIDMISSTDGWMVLGTPVNQGTEESIILRWNGTSWNQLLALQEVSLSGIDMISQNDGWAVGISSSGSRFYHWDGNSWQLFPTTLGIWADEDIDMLSATDGWAVWDSILHWDEGTWNTVSKPTDEFLNSVSLVTSNDGWAVGENGTIIHWDGNQWSVATSPTSKSLYSIEMLTTSDGWAVGDGGTIIHWNGQNWDLIPSPTTENLRSIDMLSDSKGWIVGESGIILRYEDVGTKSIILLPGIMGSRLSNFPDSSLRCSFRPQGEIWFNLLNFWGFQALRLSDDGQLPLIDCDNISATGSFARHPILFDDIYEGFISTLQSAGYPVYVFPFDWRLDLEVSAMELNKYIEEKSFDSKVVLVGHSMGGLLARKFVLDNDRAKNIEKVISVGTPYWGAPKIARNIRSGEPPGFYYNVSMPDIWDILRNSPGSMEILPSEAWFDQYGPYFMNDQVILHTYSDTYNFFVEKNQNAYLLEDARKFHSGHVANGIPDFDDFRNNNYVDYFTLYASHLGTYGMVREYPCWKGTCWNWNKLLSGDGTVPAVSARLWGSQGDWSGSATTCNFSHQVTEEHFTLMSDLYVIATVLQILQGHSLDYCQFENNSTNSISQKSDASPILLLSLWGDARIKISDELGNFTGISTEGQAINNIPLATFDPGEGGTFVTLPITSTYMITLEQYGNEPLQLHITDFRKDLAVDEYDPFERAVFVEVPSSPGGIANMSLDYPSDFNSLQLELDTDNDGFAEHVIKPTSVLDKQAIQDIIPPNSTISVEGTQDADGFYQGLLTIALDASDAPIGLATGVFKTEYSLDGGSTWIAYVEPFEIRAEDVPLITARSVDRGGNQEVPFVQMRLRPFGLFIPIIQSSD